MKYSARLLAAAEKISLKHNASDAEQRRAISTAYYAVFHRICEALEGEFDSCDAGYGHDLRVAVYRLPDHGVTVKNCQDLIKRKLFSEDLRSFSANFVTLKKNREKADYYPSQDYKDLIDVEDLLEKARNSIRIIDDVEVSERRDFSFFLALNRR